MRRMPTDAEMARLLALLSHVIFNDDGTITFVDVKEAEENA